MRRVLAVVSLGVLGCVPREAPVAIVLIPPPSEPAVASAAPSPVPAPTATYAVAPVPLPTATASIESPSLLDPMDSCLPQAATAGKAGGSAPIDRKALADELRWAKTRAEKCCPRYPGAARVVVTVGPNGAPSNVGVALPGVASADLGRCIRKLFDDVRVTPFVGAPVVEVSQVSTENAPPPSTM